MEVLNQIWGTVQLYLPKALAAIAILVVGWMVARIAGFVVGAALRRTGLNDKLAGLLSGDDSSRVSADKTAGKVVFYTVMLFVFVALFQVLGLTVLTEPLNGLLNQVFAFAPRVFAGLALGAVALLAATAVRMIITKAISGTKLDERLGQEVGGDGDGPAVTKTFGEAAYWLVLLLFLPAILGALSLNGLLQPVQGLVNEMLGALPNILSAAGILVIGWFVARIVRRIVTALLAAVGTDQLGEKIGFKQAAESQKLSGLLGLVVYVLILIPVLVSSLNALGLDAITGPTSNLLDTMLGALPGMFAATLVLAIAFAVGKFLSSIADSVLAGAGFNNLPKKLGFANVTKEGARPPSAIAGTLVLISVLLFAAVEASNLLGFAAMGTMMSELIRFGGHLLMASIIFAAGLYLSTFAVAAVQASGAPQTRILAIGARVAILVLTGAMALGQLGVADEIITLAFGLTLGALAVALAVAFGIGGREIAARQLDTWYKSVNPDATGSSRTKSSAEVATRV